MATNEFQVLFLTGLNWLTSTWSSTTVYEPGQALNYNGTSYVALSQNIDVNPATDNGSNWQVLAEGGQEGTPGNAATVTVGTTTTGATGSQAVVVNVGTESAAVLDFTLPGGQPGLTGQTGPSGAAATVVVGSVSTGAPATNAAVVNVGNSHAAVLDFTIPSGATGATGSPSSVTRFITFGDSYGANTAPGYGALRVSNGPTYSELTAIALGCNSQGRYIVEGTWNSTTYYYPGGVLLYNGQSWLCTALTIDNIPTVGSAYWQLWNPGVLAEGAAPGSIVNYSNALGWDNYAISGGTWDGANAVLTQVNLFKSDFSNVVPAGSLLFFEFTAINDTSECISILGGGMVTATDPLLGSGVPSFTQPAINGTVQVTFPSIPTGMIVGTCVWIAGGGIYTVNAISGHLVTLQLAGPFFSTNQIAATGATVTGGILRWAAAQAIDDVLASYVSTVSSLISEGATRIILSNCPIYSAAPGFSASPFNPTNIANTVGQWNTKLTAAFASLVASGQVVIFDLATQFANILANPQKYNLYDLDGGVGVSNNPNAADAIFFYDGSIHPSAATHRIYASALANVVLSFVPPSVQMLAFADLFNTETNSNPIAWTSSNPNDAITQTATPLPFPTAASSDDPRLVLAQSIGQPQLTQWIGTDYTNGLLLPDASWTSWTNGTAYAENLGSSSYQFGCFGAAAGILTATSDGYGQINSNTILIPGINGYLGKGPVSFVARIGRYSSAGDQLTLRAGIVDALILTRPANGIFLELADNGAGTFTLNLIVASAGSYTLLAAPFTSLITNANPQTFIFSGDATLRWWSVYTSAAPYTTLSPNPPVCVAVGKLPVLPEAILYPAWQAVKTGFTSAGSDYAICDGVWALANNGWRG